MALRRCFYFWQPDLFEDHHFFSLSPEEFQKCNVNLLADRIAFWRPGDTSEQIKHSLRQLTPAAFKDLFLETFKANFQYNAIQFSAILSRAGWFSDFSGTPSFHEHCAFLFVEGKDAEAHSLLESHFEQRIGDIESELSKNFPGRAALIKKAFRFHQGEEYEAAILIFLTQADGICTDVFKTGLFATSGKRLKVSKQLEGKNLDFIREALAAALHSEPPIAKPGMKRTAMLNRHMVMHGIAVDYGTKRKSLQSISLIAYIAGLAKEPPSSATRTPDKFPSSLSHE